VSSLGWIADGIARAEAAGGVKLERYYRPGFTGGPAVREVPEGNAGGGPIEVDPEPPEGDE
jgi:hypothetical protein